MRLFASIRPPAEAREHLVAALRPIRDGHGPLLRWTDPDQWHLTVAFYGERPDGAVDELAAHIAAAADGLAPFDLSLRGAGSFSGRTLWIGVGGEVAPLRALMRDCEHDPDGGSGGPQRRRAHLTVARLRARDRGDGSGARRSRRGGRWGTGGSGRGAGAGGRGRDGSRPPAQDGARVLGDVVRALSIYSGPAWTADRIELVSSRLGEGRSGGALHETVAAIPLAPRG